MLSCGPRGDKLVFFVLRCLDVRTKFISYQTSFRLKISRHIRAELCVSTIGNLIEENCVVLASSNFVC